MPRSRKPIALEDMEAEFDGPPQFGEAPPAYTQSSYNYHPQVDPYNAPYSPSYGSSYGAAC